MPGVHWPVHVFTDVSAGTVDILNINPLHKLHHAKVQQQIYGLGLLIHQHAHSTDDHLSKLFEGYIQHTTEDSDALGH